MSGENRWLTVGEAARALGVTREAVRRRIGRGTLEARREAKGNRQRLLVRLPVGDPLLEPSANPVGEPLPTPPVGPELIAELRIQVARLEERVTQREQQVDDLQRDRDRLSSLLEAERERVDRLLATITAERAPTLLPRPERRPWPGLRAMWRRLIEGEG